MQESSCDLKWRAREGLKIPSIEGVYAQGGLALEHQTR